MKRLLWMLFVLISLSASGQGIRFTVIADPQLSWLSADASNVESNGNHLGINVGLSVDDFFAPNYALSTGITIGNTGGELKYSNPLPVSVHGEKDTLPANTSLKYKLQYITVPLGLKLKTNEIGYTTFFAHLGLESGLNIKATGDANQGDLENENISDDIALFRLGYYIGGGVEYSLGGSSAIVAGLTYSNGFTDITKDSDNKATLSYLAIRLGVLF